MATEKRLIDANAVVGKIEWEIETMCIPASDADSILERFIKRVTPKLLRDVINYINKQPTVDAVEVVRCKDCKMYVENREAFVTYCHRGLNDIYAKPDDFCSYGERK